MKFRAILPFLFLFFLSLSLFPLVALGADMDVWEEVAQEASLAAPPNAVCECPLRGATVDNCAPCTSPQRCPRLGCARVYTLNKRLMVESKHCNWGPPATCGCDGATFDPPLPAGWTTWCEKGTSNQCGNWTCMTKSAAGIVSSTTIPCS